MVKAILQGQKLMTRRLNGLNEINESQFKQYLTNDTLVDRRGRFCQRFESQMGSKWATFPYGKVGDLLWVRERWRKADFPEFDGKFEFYASLENKDAAWNKGIWRPSIHMPKEAARIWLKIIEIRLERLHDISDTDIVAEGIRIPVNGIGTGRALLALGQENSALDFLPKGCLHPDGPKVTQSQLLHAFWAELWCKINGRASYDSNPWVWVIRFELFSIDKLPSDI